MIVQRVYTVRHPMGDFLSVVAHDSNTTSQDYVYEELVRRYGGASQIQVVPGGREELARRTRAGGVVVTMEVID